MLVRQSMSAAMIVRNLVFALHIRQIKWLCDCNSNDCSIQRLDGKRVKFDSCISTFFWRIEIATMVQNLLEFSWSWHGLKPFLIQQGCSCSFHGSAAQKNNSFLDMWPEDFCTYKFLCLHVQPCPLHVQHFPLIMQRDCLACVNIHMWLAHAKGCLHVQASTQEKKTQITLPSEKFQAEVHTILNVTAKQTKMTAFFSETSIRSILKGSRSFELFLRPELFVDTSIIQVKMYFE